MPKGNLNPAEAYRKAQRKKELKKNKAERSKARDLALVKKDTLVLEEEIAQLESSNGDKARLAELKTELEKINQKKEEYIKEHPEQRGLVYRKRRQRDDEEEPKVESLIPQRRNLFNKKGLPRHPERSIYYDPVMNPYGVPPPGMPYMERPLRSDEVDSDADDDANDIPMPMGPPPGSELVESEDEIFLPEGPPPTTIKDDLSTSELIPLPPSSIALPFLPPPPGLPVVNIPPPPPPPGFPPGVAVPPPFLPPPPPGFPPSSNFPLFPPPPPPGMPFNPGISYPPLPLPPPGFFPRHQSASSMQDPLSSIPHVTYQAHRARPPPSRSSLPHNPSLPPKPTAAAELANATVVAAPQLRDFKKEATAFVPTSLKRKKPASSVGLGAKFNAAPSLGLATPTDETEPDESGQASDRPDLVSMLKNQFGPTPPGPAAGAKQAEGRKNDDYAKFREEMSDILRPEP